VVSHGIGIDDGTDHDLILHVGEIADMV